MEDVTVHKMHLDFNKKYKKVRYETYHKVLETDNIGSTDSYKDEYSASAIYDLHVYEQQFSNSNKRKNKKLQRRKILTINKIETGLEDL